MGSSRFSSPPPRPATATGAASSKQRNSDADVLLDAVRASGVKRYLVVGGAGSLEVAPGVTLVSTPKFPPEHKAEATKGAESLAKPALHRRLLSDHSMRNAPLSSRQDAVPPSTGTTVSTRAAMNARRNVRAQRIAASARRDAGSPLTRSLARISPVLR